MLKSNVHGFVKIERMGYGGMRELRNQDFVEGGGENLKVSHIPNNIVRVTCIHLTSWVAQSW